MDKTQLILIAQILYLLFTLGVCIRIIWDTRSVSKTLAYLLLVIFLPIFGPIFYFSFGINYRKRKMYSKKLHADDSMAKEYRQKIIDQNKALDQSDNDSIIANLPLIKLLTNPKSGNYNPVLSQNAVEILVNGETFFPLLLEKLEKATKHIHIEFYIFENDHIGNQVKEILIRKAQAGVKVRFIYDDFGSQGIRRSFRKELQAGGVEVYPFNKIILIAFANRINYRNHRKIVVIDGETSFVGGINISDKYRNDGTNKLYWRDTQIMMIGYGTHLLQRVFLSDWNFCSGDNLSINSEYFPILPEHTDRTSQVQIAASGPDSESPTILYAILQAISLAQKEVFLTTPYYIPDETLQQTLILTALRGVDVRLLVPKNGDSFVVNTASQAYFEDLLKAGVKIHQYTKGFVHAKTIVTDRKLLFVGTANLDLRSFDLNFEVSALVYDETKASKLAAIFYADLENAEELSYEKWQKRTRLQSFFEQLLRLCSPFL